MRMKSPMLPDLEVHGGGLAVLLALPGLVQVFQAEQQGVRAEGLQGQQVDVGREAASQGGPLWASEDKSSKKADF